MTTACMFEFVRGKLHWPTWNFPLLKIELCGRRSWFMQRWAAKCDRRWRNSFCSPFVMEVNGYTFCYFGPNCQGKQVASSFVSDEKACYWESEKEIPVGADFPRWAVVNSLQLSQNVPIFFCISHICAQENHRSFSAMGTSRRSEILTLSNCCWAKHIQHKH